MPRLPRSPLLRLGLLTGWLVGLAATLLAVGLPTVEQWAAGLAGAGRWGPVLAVLGTALLVAAMVPRAVLAAAGGLLFGPLVGAACVLAGAVAGGLAAFVTGRRLGRDFALTRRRMATVDRWVNDAGVLGVCLVRLLPVAPYGLVSYAYGVSGVSARVFLIGTLAGAAPSTVVYANLGAAALSPGSPGFALSLAAAMGLGLVGVALGRWRLRRRYGCGHAEEPSHPPGARALTVNGD